jgi:CSLREA domain-containing protein
MTVRNPRVANTILRIALLVTIALAASVVHATDVTFNVNTTDDLIDDNTDDGACHTSVGTCSLRAAIMQANHLLDPGVASVIIPSGVYKLTRPVNGPNGEDNGDLNLTLPNNPAQFITITGAGFATVIDGNQLDRVFTIDPMRIAGIRDVTIRNGLRASGDGGGILNHGSLNIFGCEIENNSGRNGGGIYNDGVLKVVRTGIEANIAQANGGGIYSSGSLTIGGSSFQLNVAHNIGFGGGGIYTSGPTKVVGSTLSFNSAPSGNGGGIFNIDQLTVVNSTISYNAVAATGGGIFNFANAFLYNTTVIGNAADSEGNNSGGNGGGVNAEPASGHRFVAVNTLIASNTVHAGQAFSDCNGTLEVYGFNLLGGLSGCLFTGNGASARGLVTRSTIGPLLDNGGPTLTHALLFPSEAIDGTTVQGCTDDTGALLTTDQRGAPRINGFRCDVGAYEYGAVVDVIFKSGFQ